MPGPQALLQQVGDIRLGSEEYRLVRLKDEQAYRRDYLDEPPWSEVNPGLVSSPQYTWHLGGLKSRQGIVGTSEFGMNTDPRWAFRLLPGPKITTIDLPGATVQPSSIFEALGRIWVVSGRYVYRVNPADDTVVNSKDFGAGVSGIMGLRWEEDFGLVTTDATTNSLHKVTALGTPDTWTQTTSVSAYRMAAGINRLFKVSKTGVLKNISTTLDPMVEDNWADSVQIGDTFSVPTAILAYERTVLVAKPEGVFGVGEEGFGIPLIKRMPYSADNGLGAIVQEPWAIIPHSRGIYRFMPGLVEACGPEKDIMNESPVRGPFYTFATDGEWLYGFMDVGPDCYLMVAREPRGSESSFGPLIWDTLSHWTAAGTRSAFVSTSTNPPRLWFGYGTGSIAYITLQPNGAPPNGADGYLFASSGSRFSPRLRFDDWGDKDYPKVVLVGKNLSDTKYWDLFFSVDGSTFSTLDVDGNPMRLNADGRREFFLPATAVGREIQFRLDFSNSDPASPPELLYFEPFCAPRPRKIPILVFNLLLESNIRHERGTDARTAAEQFSDLQELAEQAASVTTYGPWGDNLNAWVQRLRLVGAFQSGQVEPSLIVEVSIQLREQA